MSADESLSHSDARIRSEATPHYISLVSLFSDRWMQRQLGPYRRYMIQILAIMAATISINFSLPLTNRALVNQGILPGDAMFVQLMIALQVGLFLSLIGLNAVRAKISGHVSNRMVSRMTGGHIAELLSLPIGYFSASRSGEIVERIRDLERVQRFAAVEAMDALTASMSILSLGLLLIFVDLSIFMFFAASAAAYLGWIYLVGLRRRQTDAANFVQSSSARALEIAMVEGMRDIKVAGYETPSLDRWSAIQIESLQTRLKATAIEQLQASGGHFLTRAGMVIVTFIAAMRTIEGTITLGDFTITSVIIVQLYFHLNQILAFTNKLEEVRAAMHRTLEIRAAFDQAQLTAQQSIKPRAIAPIEFKAVNFSYPLAGSPTLRDISLCIPEGRMTALIGPSGSGKTTILRLLLGIYQPDSGVITAAGCPLGTINQRYWLDSTGAVMQDGSMFSASIRDNVLAGRDEDSRWLEEVLAAARVIDILEASPNGLDTMLGTGGKHLSAGQQQRVQLARAFYKRPRLLLLDEATSALDEENELAIVENLRAILPDTTSLVAAHRLKTLRHAEQVVSLDGGVIREISDRVPDEAVVATTLRRSDD